MSDTTPREEADSVGDENCSEEQDASRIISPVLARLIEEVRNEKSDSPRGYNRMHNRHNRSR